MVIDDFNGFFNGETRIIYLKPQQIGIFIIH